MKWWPPSLVARTIALVVAVIVVAEATNFSLAVKHERDNRVRQGVHFVVGVIRLFQDVLPSLDDAGRRRLLAAEASAVDLRLVADGPDVPPHEAHFGFARALAAGLEGEVQGGVMLRIPDPGRRSGLWIGFLAGDERWWLILPPPRFEPQPLPIQVWISLGIALLALILIGTYFVRGIVGPLTRLGDAVAATGDGSLRRACPEGPPEIRRLAERHNEMLERLAAADGERREMLAGLTHDLRAPLARLRVRLALLDESAEQSPTVAGLGRDVDDVERISAQCLAFLRSGEHRPAPAARLVLADAVSDEIARQRELGRPIEFSADDAVAGREVAIEHGDLQRVLDNLIDNALRHGAPPVVVTLRADGPGIRLSVRDHGPGIADAQRARALEAFAQLDPARATGGSCGLGLAIVRRIATAWRAELSLDEAPGGGLVVSLRFATDASTPRAPAL